MDQLQLELKSALSDLDNDLKKKNTDHLKGAEILLDKLPCAKLKICLEIEGLATHRNTI